MTLQTHVKQRRLFEIVSQIQTQTRLLRWSPSKRVAAADVLRSQWWLKARLVSVEQRLEREAPVCVQALEHYSSKAAASSADAI